MSYLEGVCYFMLIAELLIHLRASDHYEKYIRLIMGLICLTIMIVPIMNLIIKGDSNITTVTAEEFQQQLTEAMAECNLDFDHHEYLLIETEEELKTRCEEIVSAAGYSVNGVVFDWEEEKVIGLQIYLHNNTIEIQKDSNKIEVQPIEINQEDAKETNENKEENFNDYDLISKIAKGIGVDEEYIRVILE